MWGTNMEFEVQNNKKDRDIDRELEQYIHSLEEETKKKALHSNKDL
jgi:hypothetical protein